jgi:hypothetical protein
MNGPLGKADLKSLASHKVDSGQLMKRGRFDMGRDEGGKHEDAALGKPGMKPRQDMREDMVDDTMSGPQLDRATQTRIGDQLRSMYNELMDQPVPDRFKTLLEQLDQPRNAADKEAARDPDEKREG